jgi:hypothetical protein
MSFVRRSYVRGANGGLKASTMPQRFGDVGVALGELPIVQPDCSSAGACTVLYMPKCETANISVDAAENMGT